MMSGAWLVRVISQMTSGDEKFGTRFVGIGSDCPESVRSPSYSHPTQYSVHALAPIQSVCCAEKGPMMV